jgi:hypothetical protein
MSEEQAERNENVGSSLMSALFEKIDTEEPQQEQQEQPQEEQQDDELNVYGLSDAIDMSNAEQEEPEQKDEPVVEQEEQEQEALTKYDKTLFEEVEVPAVEPEQESEEPVQEVVQEQEDLTWLTTDQKKRLELVEFAEDNFEEYKGKKSQYLQFFKDQKDYLDKRLEEDPNSALDDSDYDYQNFLKRKKPQFSQDDLERVVELRTRKLAKQEAMEELKPELDAIKQEQKKQQVKPIVESLKEQTLSDIRSMVPEDMRKKLESEGAKAAYEANPVQYEIVNRITTAHQKAMFALHEISQGLSSYDPTNKDHIRLASFISSLEASMPEKDGMKYSPMHEYHNLSDAEKQKVYTLTTEEVKEHANKSAQKFINKEINNFEDKLRKSGYTKAGRQPVATQQTAAPRPVKPQPRQGPTVNTPVATEQSQKNPVLSALGL